ncbi:MAG: alcohol dehydrogenase catalytic domain-containing protein [Nitrospirota bacterium]
MQAGILIKPGIIEYREVNTPRPSPGEILVKIKAALTCGTDLKAFIRGHPMIPMPGVFGHEFSGIIAKTGKGAKNFKEGDEIMAVHSAPCLECRYCEKRRYNLCEKIMNKKVLGAFAEYVLLPSHIVKQNVFYKPKRLTFEEAAFLEPLSCVVHCLKPLNIKRGNHTLVLGAGPIGLLHLLLLKEKGVIVVITDVNGKRLSVAKGLGADLAVKPQNIAGVMKDFNDDIGFDYVFECTGTTEAWGASIDYASRGGTVILFGGCKKGTKVTYDTARLHYDEITLKGVFHYNPSDVKEAYRLLCDGKLGVSRLLSGNYPLRHIQRVFNKLAKGIGIKYAIIP